MDRRERKPDPEDTLRTAFASMQSRIWTTLPGIIQSFNAEELTAEVQPALNGVLKGPDGSLQTLKMPLLTDCPVMFPGGGGMTLVFPVAAGDECTIHFSARCIDLWWELGGVQDQAEFRMHDLSDGFVSVGVRSKAKAFTADPGVVRLRSDDDSFYLEMNPTAKTAKILATGGINLNGVTIDSSGNVHSAATITGDTDVIAAGKSGKGHLHSGVQSGGSNSGPPV